MKATFGLAVAATTLLLLSTAQAQISPFRGSRVTKGLSKADVDALFQATQQVNSANPVHVGDMREWTNAAGAKGGSVSVTRLFKSGGLSCHALRYDFATTAGRPTRTYTGDWCKTKSGDWKIKD